MRIVTLTPLLLVGGLAACGGAANDPKAQDFAEICGEQLNFEEAVCDCIGERAENDLDLEERRFLYATLTEDREAAEAARAELTLEGAAQAGMFLTNAPAACMREANEG